MGDTKQTPEDRDRQNSIPMATVIEQLLEAGATDRGARDRLEQLLRDNDDALRKYLILMDLDARLRWAFRGGAIAPSAHEATAIGRDGGSHSPATATPQSSRPRTSGPSQRASAGGRLDPAGSDLRRWTGRRPAAVVGLAACLAAVLLISVTLGSKFGRSGVGKLTQSAAAEWAEPFGALTPGRSISSGQELYLLAGIAEISLHDGTRLIVEGPTSFQIRSADNAFLKTGTISVFVGESAAGFTLQTPDTRIVDLGTAFRARTVELGTEVHVIEGEVSVSATGGAGNANAASELHLSARDAVRINAYDGSAVAVEFVGEQLKLHGKTSLSAIPKAVTGDIRCLDQPPTSVAVGELEHDGEMVLFVEHNDIVLERTLYADRNSKGDVASKDGNLNMQISAGTRISSYLLHFDPTTEHDGEPLHRVSGTITFRSPILAVFLSQSGLYESDKYLRHSRTTYVRGDGELANRGIDEEDFVAFSPDRKTIIVKLGANVSADQIRILTAKEVP